MQNKNELIAAIGRGESFSYLFFWNEAKPKGKRTDKSCLNQWYKASFSISVHAFGELHELTFATAEHYMMYKKAELFKDYDIRNQIYKSQSPKEAQALGRAVKNYDDSIWQAISFEVVVDANMHKFAQHEKLQRYLLSTGDKVLVEASPVDCIWGIGLDKDDPKAQDPSTWRGENKLGFALMEVRKRLKEEGYYEENHTF